MFVTYIEVPTNEVGQDIYIRFNSADCGETVVHIGGYGTADYTVRVMDREGRTPVHIQDFADASGLFDASVFGTALVWADPVTIAHLVDDFIRNQ